MSHQPIRHPPDADLIARLLDLGVYPDPAKAIAQVWHDADPEDVIAALRRHVQETGSLPLAVWRLKQGILTTGQDHVDDIQRRRYIPPEYEHIINH